MEEPLEERLRSGAEERNLLSSVFQSQDAWLRVSDIVGPEDFTHTVNRTLWSLLDDMRQNNIVPSPVGIHDRLPDVVRKEIDDLGGWAYIEALATLPISPENAEHHARALRDLTILRRGREAGKRISELAESKPDANEFLDQTEAIVNEIPGDVGSDVILLGSVAREYVEQRMSNPTELPGISTGYEYLDSITQGLQPGRMYVIGARTGIGKSIMHLNMVRNIAVLQGLPVLYISTEQGAQDEISRLISIEAEMPEAYLGNGSFANMPGYTQQVSDAVDRVETAPIHFSYDPMFTPAKLYRVIKKYAIVHKVAAVFFDYIKIPTGNVGSHDKWAVVGDLAYGLKAVAGDLNIPVVTAVQVNRDGAEQFKFTGEIDESAFANSDMIVQASSVSAILRPLNKDEKEQHSLGVGEKRMLTFVKNRHGSKSDKILFALSVGYTKLHERERIVAG